MAADDSGDEFEPFQMTEEEFLPKRRKMTKEDHIYGLWAEHDSDEDDRYLDPLALLVTDYLRSVWQDTLLVVILVICTVA